MNGWNWPRAWVASGLAAAVLVAGCGGDGPDGGNGGSDGGGGSGGGGAVRHILGVGVSGSGNVRSQPAGIDCNGTCSGSFDAGTSVTLTATPAAGQVFGGWGGACRGSHTTCTLTLGAALTATAAFIAAPPAAGWNDASFLSTAAASGPKVAIDAEGRAFAVWQQQVGAGTQAGIWSSRYTPATGWSAPQRLEANTGSVQRIAVAIDPASGRGMALWVFAPSGAAAADLWGASLDPATGWSAASLLESSSGAVRDFSPGVGVDANGNAVAVWGQTGPGTAISIYANRYTPGAGWGTAALVESNETSGSQDFDPVLAVAPNGDALAVWKRSSGSSASLWSGRYLAGGTWGTATEVVPDEGALHFIGAHDLAMDGAGNAMLAWGASDWPAGAASRENTISFKRFSGGAWQGTVAQVAPAVPGTSGNPGYTGRPFLRMNAIGSALVGWVRVDNAVMAAYAAPGAAFGTATTVRPAGDSLLGGTDEALSLGLDDAGNALAAWSARNPAATGDLNVAQLTAGAAWGLPTLHATAGEAWGPPSLAMNERGNAVLGWAHYIAGEGSRIAVRQYGSGR